MYLSNEDLRLGPPTYWSCGFESRRINGCLSLVSVAFSSTGLCDGPTECGVSEYNLET